MPCFLMACGGNEADRHPFYYPHKAKEDFQSYLYYSDDCFSLPASVFQPSLASASIGLAMAGFASNRNQNKNDYERRYRNAEALFQELGFTDFAANESYKKKPGVDTFGVAIARKKVQNATLLGITVRGGNYEMEWGSNFLLGDGESSGYATGFLNASDLYLQALNAYLKEYQIQGKIKIWTAGYSRGGAAVNLSAGRIDDALLQGKSLLPEGVTYAKDDIYAYCFEPPAGAYFTSEQADKPLTIKGEGYDNIQCFVNLNDPVPFVAPAEFGFCRYGKEYYLTDPVTDPHYAENIARVKSDFLQLMKNAGVTDYLIDQFVTRAFMSDAGLRGADLTKANWTQGRYLATLIRELSAGIGSRQAYASAYETGVKKIFEVIYSASVPKDSLVNIALGVGRTILVNDHQGILLYDLLHNRSRLIQDLRPYLYQALNTYGLDLDIEEILNLLLLAVDAILKTANTPEGLSCFASLIDRNNVSGLAQAHFPELCFAHMRAMDSRFGSAHQGLATSYRKLVIPNEGGVSFVLSYQGKEVAQFEEGRPLALEGGVPCGIEGGVISVYLPDADGYELHAESALKVSSFRKRSDTINLLPLGERNLSGGSSYSIPR